MLLKFFLKFFFSSLSMSVTVHRFPVVFGFTAFLISEALFTEIHSPITTLEIICIMALTLEPIRGCPQHSGETGT